MKKNTDFIYYKKSPEKSHAWSMAFFLTVFTITCKLKKAFFSLRQKTLFYFDMKLTVHCVNHAPQTFDGSLPANKNEAWSFASTSCEFTDIQSFLAVALPTTTISTSTDVKIYGSMSAGEIMISLLLFLIFWAKLIEMLARGLSAVKTKKTFLGYQGGDVEIREDS